MENTENITSENITMIDPWMYLLESIQAIALENDKESRLNIAKSMIEALQYLDNKDNS